MTVPEAIQTATIPERIPIIMREMIQVITIRTLTTAMAEIIMETVILPTMPTESRIIRHLRY